MKARRRAQDRFGNVRIEARSFVSFLTFLRQRARLPCPRLCLSLFLRLVFLIVKRERDRERVIGVEKKFLKKLCPRKLATISALVVTKNPRIHQEKPLSVPLASFLVSLRTLAKRSLCFCQHALGTYGSQQTRP